MCITDREWDETTEGTPKAGDDSLRAFLDWFKENIGTTSASRKLDCIKAWNAARQYDRSREGYEMNGHGMDCPITGACAEGDHVLCPVFFDDGERCACQSPNCNHAAIASPGVTLARKIADDVVQSACDSDPADAEDSATLLITVEDLRGLVAASAETVIGEYGERCHECRNEEAARRDERKANDQ